MYLLFFVVSDKEKIIESKTEHELNVINSFETALIEQHDMSHNELLQQSQILNELPLQQQPVIVSQSPVKMPNMVLENDGMYFCYSNLFILLTLSC